MKCPKCGKEIASDSNFCEFCGTQVRKIRKPKRAPWIVLSIVFSVFTFIFGIMTFVEYRAKQNFSKEIIELETELTEYELEEERAEYIREKGYVDLGLPSGTLWKDQNEDASFNFYYDKAISKYRGKLPSKGQFEELKDYCIWTWIGNGYMVKGPNGNYIILPAMGWRDQNGSTHSLGTDGWYCFDTPNQGYLYFAQGTIRTSDGTLTSCCVRLVAKNL